MQRAQRGFKSEDAPEYQAITHLVAKGTCGGNRPHFELEFYMQPNAAPRPATSLPKTLGDEDLKAFQRLAMDATGIKLEDAKRSMIYTRFLRRLRALRMSTFAQYIEHLESGDPAERETFVNTITTNLTYFFREPHHFEFLHDDVVPALKVRRGPDPVRVWSAGCSSGEEPYSIAMTLAEAGLIGGSQYKLLCTDIDTNMVARTHAGQFRESDIRGLSDERRSRWFDSRGDQLQAKNELRRGMMCRPLNLFVKWPIRHGVDVIFCRNVLIYFERERQDQIVTEFSKIQEPGGYLFLGHSESLRGFEKTYKRVSNTVYRRV